MPRGKCRMALLAALILAVLLQAAPALSAAPKPADVPNRTLVVGAYLIELEALDKEIYKLALDSAADSQQQKIYYKSEFGGGAWFDITNGDSIQSLTVQKGTLASNAEMTAVFARLRYWVHARPKFMIEDLSTNTEITIGEIYDGTAIGLTKPGDLNETKALPGEKQKLEGKLQELQALRKKRGLSDAEKTNYDIQMASIQPQIDALENIMQPFGSEAYNDLSKQLQYMDRYISDVKKRLTDYKDDSVAVLVPLKEQVKLARDIQACMELKDRLESAKKKFPDLASALSEVSSNVSTKLDGLNEQAKDNPTGLLEQEKAALGRKLTDMITQDKAQVTNPSLQVLAKLRVLNALLERRPVEDKKTALAMLEEIKGKLLKDYMEKTSRPNSDEYLQALKKGEPAPVLKSLKEKELQDLKNLYAQKEYINAMILQLKGGDNQSRKDMLTADKTALAEQLALLTATDGPADKTALLNQQVEELTGQLNALITLEAGQTAAGAAGDELKDKIKELQEAKLALLEKGDIAGAKAVEAQIQSLSDQLDKLALDTVNKIAELNMQKSLLENNLDQAVKDGDTGRISDIKQKKEDIDRQIAAASASLPADAKKALDSFEAAKKALLDALKAGDIPGAVKALDTCTTLAASIPDSQKSLFKDQDTLDKAQALINALLAQASTHQDPQGAQQLQNLLAGVKDTLGKALESPLEKSVAEVLRQLDALDQLPRGNEAAGLNMAKSLLESLLDQTLKAGNSGAAKDINRSLGDMDRRIAAASASLPEDAVEALKAFETAKKALLDALKAGDIAGAAKALDNCKTLASSISGRGKDLLKDQIALDKAQKLIDALLDQANAVKDTKTAQQLKDLLAGLREVFGKIPESPLEKFVAEALRQLDALEAESSQDTKIAALNAEKGLLESSLDQAVKKDAGTAKELRQKLEDINGQAAAATAALPGEVKKALMDIETPKKALLGALEAGNIPGAQKALEACKKVMDSLPDSRKALLKDQATLDKAQGLIDRASAGKDAKTVQQLNDLLAGFREVFGKTPEGPLEKYAAEALRQLETLGAESSQDNKIAALNTQKSLLESSLDQAVKTGDTGKAKETGQKLEDISRQIDKASAPLPAEVKKALTDIEAPKKALLDALEAGNAAGAEKALEACKKVMDSLPDNRKDLIPDQAALDKVRELAGVMLDQAAANRDAKAVHQLNALLAGAREVFGKAQESPLEKFAAEVLRQLDALGPSQENGITGLNMEKSLLESLLDQMMKNGDAGKAEDIKQELADTNRQIDAASASLLAEVKEALKSFEAAKKALLDALEAGNATGAEKALGVCEKVMDSLPDNRKDLLPDQPALDKVRELAGAMLDQAFAGKDPKAVQRLQGLLAGAGEVLGKAKESPLEKYTAEVLRQLGILAAPSQSSQDTKDTLSRLEAQRSDLKDSLLNIIDSGNTGAVEKILGDLNDTIQQIAENQKELLFIRLDNIKKLEKQRQGEADMLKAIKAVKADTVSQLKAMEKSKYTPEELAKIDGESTAVTASGGKADVLPVENILSRSIYVKLNAPLVKIDGDLYIPARAIYEFFDATVLWSDQNKKAVVFLGGKEIVLEIGKITATVNGKPWKLPRVPELIKGRTYAPLSFIAQSLGFEYEWLEEENAVIIKADFCLR